MGKARPAKSDVHDPEIELSYASPKGSVSSWNAKTKPPTEHGPINMTFQVA